MLWGNAPSSDEICWGKRYGNKNVKMIFYMIWGEKMPLVVMKNIGGKITTTNLPPRPPSTPRYQVLATFGNTRDHDDLLLTAGPKLTRVRLDK